MSELLEKITAGDLAQFIGTTTHYRHWSRLVLTDGAMYLCRHGASWLLDILGSVRHIPEINRATYEFWKLVVDLEKSTATIQCTDGGNGASKKVLYTQDIPYTDFPLAEINLLVAQDPMHGKVVMLHSEY